MDPLMSIYEESIWMILRPENRSGYVMAFASMGGHG